MTDLESSQITPSQANDSSRSLPPLGIIHLMSWVTVSAVFFWQARLSLEQLNEGVYDVENSLPISFATLLQITWGLFSITAGAVITGLGALIGRRLRDRGPLLYQPGHWLVLTYATASFFQFCIGIITAFGSYPLSNWFSRSGLWMGLIISIFTASIYALALWRVTIPRWRLVFVLLATNAASQALVLWISLQTRFFNYDLVTTLSTANQYMTLGIGVIVVVISIIDIVKRCGYNWVHWTGVASVTLSIATTIIWTLGTLVFQ